MIPLPPSPKIIIDGITYALKMSLRQTHPSAMPPTTEAIWHALWVRFALIILNSTIMLEERSFALFAMLIPIAVIDVLSYPVVSHFALLTSGNEKRFPLFILAMTWIGNLRVIILMTTLLIIGIENPGGGIFLLLAVGMWMLWATWSVATISLNHKALAGVGMIALMMVVEILNANILIRFVLPLVNTPLG